MFKYFDAQKARFIIGKKFKKKLDEGYVLHVGGNQWYKNRKGVIEIYNAWRSMSSLQHPLLLIGEKLSSEILAEYERSPFREDIYLLHNRSDEDIHLAYSGASVFLFPSLAEGFGWPIIEAMASGCVVITTNEAPMTEVAGDAAILIPPRPFNEKAIDWAKQAAVLVEKTITQSQAKQEIAIQKGLLNAQRFNMESSLDEVENIYYSILDKDKIYRRSQPLLS